MLETMKDAGYATGTAGMMQNKVKPLRHAYIRAKDAVNRSGASPEDALKKCPFFVLMPVWACCQVALFQYVGS